MRCEQVRELLPLLAEGEGPEEAARHLASCAGCAAARDAVAALQGDLDRLCGATKKTDTERAAATARLLSPRREVRTGRARPLFWAPLAAAAALAVAVLLTTRPAGRPDPQAPIPGEEPHAAARTAAGPRFLPPEILGMFDDPDEGARLYATAAIGRHGEASMAAPLARIVAEDPSPAVRRAAREALHAVWRRGEASLPPLALEGDG